MATIDEIAFARQLLMRAACGRPVGSRARAGRRFSRRSVDCSGRLLDGSPSPIQAAEVALRGLKAVPTFGAPASSVMMSQLHQGDSQRQCAAEALGTTLVTTSKF